LKGFDDKSVCEVLHMYTYLHTPCTCKPYGIKCLLTPSSDTGSLWWKLYCHCSTCGSIVFIPLRYSYDKIIAFCV